MNNGQIAPHEGRELDLVLAGDKPLAVIEKRKQPEAYQRAFDLREAGGSGLYIMSRIGDEGSEIVITRDWENLSAYNDAVAMPDGPDKHWALGRLFGYSPEDIEAFIANPPECNCSKCRSKAA